MLQIHSPLCYSQNAFLLGTTGKLKGHFEVLCDTNIWTYNFIKREKNQNKLATTVM